MQEYAPLAITLVAIFAGMLVNKSDLHSLKADILARFERTDKQIDNVNAGLLVIEADLRQFYSITGELKGRMDAVEKRR